MRNLFAAFVLIAVAGWGTWFAGPDLLRDARIYHSYTAAPEAVQVAASCRSRIVLTICDTSIVGAGATGSARLLFLDAWVETRPVYAVQSQTYSNRVSTSLAMEYFWNRIWTLIGFAGLFLILGLASFAQLFNRAPRSADAGGGAPTTTP